MSQIANLTEPKSSVSAQSLPLVSIGLPVYNEEKHLREVLDSLLAQDYENFEIIISDNASTDGTGRICEEYLPKDERIRYYRNTVNIGGIDNFNRTSDLANGEFFVWASGHDLRHPTFLSRCVDLLRRDPSVVLCHTEMLWIDADGQSLEQNPGNRLDTRGIADLISRLNVVLWGLTGGFPIYGVLRASALERTRMNKRVVAPDIAMLINLSLLGTFAYISEPLFYPRKLPDHGDWKAFVQKHFKHSAGGWSAQMLFWRMVGELIRVVWRNTKTFGGRVIGITFVLLAMFLKYHWMLTGLLSIRKSRA